MNLRGLISISTCYIWNIQFIFCVFCSLATTVIQEMQRGDCFKTEEKTGNTTNILLFYLDVIRVRLLSVLIEGRLRSPIDRLKCGRKVLRLSRRTRTIDDLVCTRNPLLIVIFSFLTKLAIKFHTNPSILKLKCSAREPRSHVQQSRDLVQVTVIILSLKKVNLTRNTFLRLSL